MPTKTENKQMERLFLAVFFNDLEKVIEFKNQYPKLYEKKRHFIIDNRISFDLINLTFFNQTVWKSDDWNKDIMPLIKKNRQRTEQMLNFWRMELDPDIKREMEYIQYCDYFYCDCYTDTYEEWKKYEMKDIKIEFREIDLMLMYQVERFNFVETKKLLEQGAKSDIDFYDDDFSSVDSRIGTEYSFLATTFVVPYFKIFEQKSYNQDFDITDMFGRLLGLAAHEDMYQLINAYTDAK